jgi:N-acetyl-alpha-D-muramate 1-phosphate uridylyltransferase
MKAMILAAGRGERMRPLTDTTPKPLLKVRGKPLIEWHLEALARGGVKEVVINTAWLEDRFEQVLGHGERWNLRIVYSMEGRDHGHALETAGGIAKALPLLTTANTDCFWLMSGDIFAPDFVIDPRGGERFAQSGHLAHVWLVPNPVYHLQGDFGMDAEGFGLADAPTSQRLTYANLALCRGTLCAHITPGSSVALGPLLFEGMRQQRITAEVYSGLWHNVGTPEQLADLNA